MIEILKEGQDSPLNINESSYAMKNKENLKNPMFNNLEAEEKAINQILGKGNTTMQLTSKNTNQLKRLRTKNKNAVLRGKGGRPLLTKLRPQYEVKRVKELKKIINKHKKNPKNSKKERKLKKKLKYQNQEIIGKNLQRKGKSSKVDLNLIRKKKLQSKNKKR